MSAPSGFVTRKVKIAEIALWTGAALVTLGLYFAAAAWVLRTELVVAADNSPLAAIMIEFADAPEAATTEMNEITPDQKPAEETVAQLEQKAKETPPDEPLKQVPGPELTEPDREGDQGKPVPLEKVEVTLPPVQSKREKPKAKLKPRKQQASAESRASVQAQAQVPQSDRTAAAQTASGVSSLSPANWRSRLMAHLERRKQYPSAARAHSAQGIVYVRFTIDDAGNVQSASLARTSGFAELDQEVLALVRRASPVPAPPPGAQRTITAPVRFSTN